MTNECEACRERLGQFLEGTLPGVDRDAVSAHLEACPACHEYLEQLEKVDRLLALIPREESVPPELTDKILALPTTAPAGRRQARTVRTLRGAPHRGPAWRRPAVWATAAAIVLTAMLAWILTRPGSPPPNRDDVPPPKPRAVSARLFVNRTVGRLLDGASYRIYDPRFGQLFLDLSLLGIRPALSWNNLRLALDTPHRAVRSDDTGRVRLDAPLGTGAHLVYVQKPGHLGAWALLDVTDVDRTPDTEAILYPSVSLEVSGRVVDAATNAPLGGALVATPDGTSVAVTDPDGRFRNRFELATGRTPRLYAFAPGHTEQRVVVPSDALKRGTFARDFRLSVGERHDLRLRLVGPDGAPVEDVQVLARPDFEGRPEPPRLRRGPELGVSDAGGRVTLSQILDYRYRIEVHDPRFDVKGPHYVDPGRDEEVEIRLAPGGDARFHATITRPDGKPLAGGQVVFSRIRIEGGETRTTRILNGATDLEGNVAFTGLRSGRAVLQIITPDGAGYYVTFNIDRGDVVSIEYRLPPGLHHVRGRVRGKGPAASAYRMVRLQGELPRVQAGRHKSERHYYAVETPVASDGTFTFPPVPRLINPQILGRPAADPTAMPDMLRSEPSLKEAVSTKEEGSRQIEVGRGR